MKKKYWVSVCMYGGVEVEAEDEFEAQKIVANEISGNDIEWFSDSIEVVVAEEVEE